MATAWADASSGSAAVTTPPERSGRNGELLGVGKARLTPTTGMAGSGRRAHSHCWARQHPSPGQRSGEIQVASGYLHSPTHFDNAAANASDSGSGSGGPASGNTLRRPPSACRALPAAALATLSTNTDSQRRTPPCSCQRVLRHLYRRRQPIRLQAVPFPSSPIPSLSRHAAMPLPPPWRQQRARRSPSLLPTRNSKTILAARHGRIPLATRSLHTPKCPASPCRTPLQRPHLRCAQLDPRPPPSPRALQPSPAPILSDNTTPDTTGSALTSTPFSKPRKARAATIRTLPHTGAKDSSTAST